MKNRSGADGELFSAKKREFSDFLQNTDNQPFITHRTLTDISPPCDNACFSPWYGLYQVMKRTVSCLKTVFIAPWKRPFRTVNPPRMVRRSVQTGLPAAGYGSAFSQNWKNRMLNSIWEKLTGVKQNLHKHARRWETTADLTFRTTPPAHATPAYGRETGGRSLTLFL